MKKISYLLFLIIILFSVTGCFKRDSLEDVTIYTTVYPIEYLTNELYGDNSEVLSIYPDGINPSEYTLDELPFVMTSTRIISLSGGYPIDYSMNSIVPKGTWRVLQLERAQDLDNLGGNLREWEQKGRFYFLDEKPYRSYVERDLTGSKSRLNGLQQYSDIYFTIEKDNKAGINNKEYTYITYHVLVPFGRTDSMELLFQKLAGSAGVDFEVK